MLYYARNTAIHTCVCGLCRSPTLPDALQGRDQRQGHLMRGLQQLERRLRSRGLFLIEPDGQDGRLCQYLAILHQLKLNNASTVHGLCEAYALESEMIEWLAGHAGVECESKVGLQACLWCLGASLAASVEAA